MCAQPPTPVKADLISFLRQQGAGDYELMPLAGGANNRVFRVPRPQGDWVLKCYFQNPGDSRDRFGAERAFYQWIWSRSIHRIPEPLAWDAQQRLGLFTLVPGRKLLAPEVDLARVREALDFLIELNVDRDRSDGLPVASEGCFSLDEHLACVDRRIARLQQVTGTEEVVCEAAAFVQQQLTPAWARIRATITSLPAGAASTAGQPIPAAQRCLSPSDFGFHNALLHPDGHLRFFDFEYAGWDDPAKSICDFFCQPELSVPPGLWDEFAGGLARGLKAGAGLPARARRLWPAYQIKWCCIMLNEFVSSEQTRRAFAAGVEVSTQRRITQLAKAAQGLRKAVELSGGSG